MRVSDPFGTLAALMLTSAFVLALIMDWGPGHGSTAGCARLYVTSLRWGVGTGAVTGAVTGLAIGVISLAQSAVASVLLGVIVGGIVGALVAVIPCRTLSH